MVVVVCGSECYVCGGESSSMTISEEVWCACVIVCVVFVRVYSCRELVNDQREQAYTLTLSGIPKKRRSSASEGTSLPIAETRLEQLRTRH